LSRLHNQRNIDPQPFIRHAIFFPPGVKPMQPGDITILLDRVREGDPAAPDELVAILKDGYCRYASRRLRHERRGHSLETGDLFQEGILKLLRGNEIVQAADRKQLFAAYARAIREVLIDHARRRDADKRGGDWERQAFDDQIAAVEQASGSRVLDLHDALTALAVEYPEEAAVMELHYFGEHTLAEVAAVLGVSLSTVERRHRFARAWLRVRLGPGGTP
jgi:RNA polymerase sigma factor (TIGR02999 family)